MVTDFDLEEGIIKILGSRETHKIISNFSFFINMTEAFPIWPTHSTRILSSLYIESMDVFRNHTLYSVPISSFL